VSSTLIQNGHVIDPANNIDRPADILIRDGTIVSVSTEASTPAAVASDVDEVIDATGFLVTPGFIDTHVSLREPGFEEDESSASGTAAALSAGFTTIAAMPDTDPVVDNRSGAEFVRLQAERAGNCRVFPLGAITKNAEGHELAEIGQLVEGGAVGFTEGKRPLNNAEVMRRALEYAHMFDRPILHFAMVPELADGGVMHEGFQSTRLGLQGIPAAAQDIMTGRDIALADLTGAHLHLMCVSTADSVERIRVARSRGIHVTADVTPHHLLLTDQVMESFDTMFKCNPPLRSQQHVDALIAGLKDRTITSISADHQPLAIEKKSVELDRAPFGICGLESVLPVCVKALIETQHLTWSELTALLTVGPASILDLNSGTLSPGRQADVTLIDPSERWTIDANLFRSKSRNTPFDGMSVKGRVIMTFVGGECRYRLRR
jgi:dihydroorotase